MLSRIKLIYTEKCTCELNATLFLARYVRPPCWLLLPSHHPLCTMRRDCVSGMMKQIALYKQYAGNILTRGTKRKTHFIKHAVVLSFQGSTESTDLSQLRNGLFPTISFANVVCREYALISVGGSRLNIVRWTGQWPWALYMYTL